MFFDCTQALDDDFEDVPCNENDKTLVGCLVVSGTRHNIFSGSNIVGRDAVSCDIVLNRNMVLEPQVRYNLDTGTNLYFGNVHGQYLKIDVKDSTMDTTVCGEKDVECLKTSVKKAELSDDSETDVEGDSSANTVTGKHCEDVNEDAEGTNIFDLKSHCQDGGGIDAADDDDDAIFYMETQESVADMVRPSSDLLAVNKNIKDRSLLEDDSDIFDNLVLDESREEIACTVEGTVEEKQLRCALIQESDCSGDETDPENILMEKTQNLKMSGKEEDCKLVNNKINVHDACIQRNVTQPVSCVALRSNSSAEPVIHSYSASSASLQGTLEAVNEQRIPHSKRSNNKTPGSDGSDVKIVAHQETFLQISHAEEGTCIASLSTQNVDNEKTVSLKDSSGNSLATHSQNVIDKVVGNELVHKESSNRCYITCDIMNAPTQILNNDKVVLKGVDVNGTHNVQTETLNDELLNEKGNIQQISIRCENSDTSQVPVTHLDVSNSCENTTTLIDASTQVQKVKVGTVDHQDINNRCNITNDIIDAQTHVVNEDFSRRIAYKNKSFKFNGWNDISNEATQVLQDKIFNDNITCKITNNIMDEPTQVLKNDFAKGKVVHQDTYGDCINIKNEFTDASTGVMRNEIGHQDVYNSYEITHDTRDASTRVTKGEVIFGVNVHGDTFNKSQNLDDILDAPTQVLEGEIPVNEVVRYASSDSSVIPELTIEASTPVVKDEVVMGTVIHQDNSKRSCIRNNIINVPNQVTENEVVNHISSDQCEMNDNIMNAPNQMATHEVSVGLVVHQDTSKVCETGNNIIDAPNQNLKYEVAMGTVVHQDDSKSSYIQDDIFDAPTQVTEDEVAHLMPFEVCEINDDIIDAPTQIVKGEISAALVAHQGTSKVCEITNNTMDAPNQNLKDEVAMGTVVHQDDSKSSYIQDDIFDAPTQVTEDEVAHLMPFEVCEINDDIIDAPTQIVKREISAALVAHQSTSKVCEITNNTMEAPTEILKDEVVMGTVVHQDDSKRSYIQNDIFDAPTQVIEDEVAHQMPFEVCEINDDIMDAPTQIVKGEISADLVAHQGTSKVCEITNNTMDAPTEILKDEVVMGTVVHQDDSKRSYIQNDIFDAPTQVIEDEVAHQMPFEVCEINDDIMDSPTQNVRGEVSASLVMGLMVHQDNSKRSYIQNDIFDAPTQVVEDKLVHQLTSDRCKINNDIMDSPTQKVKGEISAGIVAHQRTSKVCEIANNTMDAPTQILKDEVFMGTVVHQDDSKRSCIQNDIFDALTQVTEDEVVHQFASNRCEINDDIMDEPTQIVEGDVSVGIVVNNDNSERSDITTVVKNESNHIVYDDPVRYNVVSPQNTLSLTDEINNVGDSPILQMPVKNVENNTGKIILQDTIIKPAGSDDVSDAVAIGQAIHQDSTAVLSNCNSDYVMNSSHVEREGNVAQKGDYSNGGIVDVEMHTTCVSSTSHQNISFVHTECSSNDIMNSPIKIVCEESNVLLKNCSGTDSKFGCKNDELKPSDENICNNNIGTETVMSPILSYTKRHMSNVDKQHEKPSQVNMIDIKHLEMLTSGGSINHLGTYGCRENENTEDTVPAVLRQKSPRTYGSKQNVGRQKSYNNKKSFEEHSEVLFASGCKVNAQLTDIKGNITISSELSPKKLQSQSQEKNKSECVKELTNSMNVKNCSAQQIWPGKHQSYSGKRLSQVKGSSLLASTSNNVGELLVIQNRQESLTNNKVQLVTFQTAEQQCKVGKKSARSRNNSCYSKSSPKDQQQNKEFTVQIENLNTRPKRSRKMTWKMIELEKASPTSVKTEDQTCGAKSPKNVVQDTVDMHDNDSSVVQDSTFQNTNSPLAQQKEDERASCSRKQLSENSMTSEVAISENLVRKKNIPRVSLKRKGVTTQAEEGTHRGTKVSSLRKSSRELVKASNLGSGGSDTGDKLAGGLTMTTVTSDGTNEKLQERKGTITRSGRKLVTEEALTEKVFVGSRKREKSRVKENCSAQALNEAAHEKMQNNYIKEYVSNIEIQTKTNDEGNISRKRSKSKAELITEETDKKRVRESKNKMTAENNLQFNLSTNKTEIDSNKSNSTEETEKSLTSKLFTSSKERVSKPLQESKVKTRNSGNKRENSTAGTSAKVKGSRNINKRTKEHTVMCEKNDDGYEECIEKNVNIRKKRQKTAEDESPDKRKNQAEAVVDDGESVSVSGINVHLQKRENMPGRQSRQRKQSGLSSSTSSSVSDEDRAAAFRGDSQSSPVEAGAATSRESLLSTKLGKGQRASRKHVAPAETTRVMFTGLTKEELKAQETIVERLGGSVVDQPGAEMVLVAQKLCRTIKMLCAIARGIPVVNCLWLKNCSKKNQFVDTEAYILHDTEGERKFNMSLSKTLRAAALHPLLTGYSVMVTPHVVPVPKDMKVLVESCGGIFVSRSPRNWPSRAFVISCEEDRTQWSKLRKAGVSVVGTEAILGGVLQHHIDLVSHQLHPS